MVFCDKLTLSVVDLKHIGNSLPPPLGRNWVRELEEAQQELEMARSEIAELRKRVAELEGDKSQDDEHWNQKCDILLPTNCTQLDNFDILHDTFPHL